MARGRKGDSAREKCTVSAGVDPPTPLETMPVKKTPFSASGKSDQYFGRRKARQGGGED